MAKNKNLGKKPEELTDLQRRFAIAYVRTGNATRAAKEAGYHSQTGNEATWSSIGYGNLREPKVIAEIERLYMIEGMRALETIYRLSTIARGNITEFMKLDTEGYAHVDTQKIMDSPIAFIIKDLEITHNRDKDGTIVRENVKLHLHDALSALDKIGRFHELFTTRLKIDDWRSRAISDIRRGLLTYEPLAEEFGDDLAKELFESAGVSVTPRLLE